MSKDIPVVDWCNDLEYMRLLVVELLRLGCDSATVVDMAKHLTAATRKAAK